MNIISTAYAQQQSPSQPSGPGGMLGMFFPLIIVFVIFYFLIFRPQQKSQRAKREMLAALKRGDEVVTNGGMYGKITDLTDKIVMLQIANNVTVKLDRSQVNLVVAKPQ